MRKEPRPVAAPTAFSLDKLLRVLGAEESSDRKGKVMMYFFVGHDKIMYMYNLCKCTCGRALCLEYRVSWVRVPLFLGKVTALGVLCCFALFVCLTLLASFFLPSHLSFKNMYILGLVWLSLVVSLPRPSPSY